MTITLTEAEDGELWDEAAQNSPPNAPIELFESFWEMPRLLGNGYKTDIELHPHLWLTIFDYEHHDDLLLKLPTSNHPLQFSVLLSGNIKDDYGRIGEGNTLISGGGIQRSMKTMYCQSSRMVGIDINMSPDLLATFFPGKDGGIPPELKLLAKNNDWQTLIYPEITPAIRFLAQQIFNCPYHGMTKRIYLQAKVLELIALQLALILEDGATPQLPPPLKPETIARIHHAKKIMLSRLEHPPSLTELAGLVGISDRTLRKGFKELFGTTVFAYLTQKRMEQAEQFLRGGKMSIAEVANMVGYSHLGHFAAAFKRRYGITPKECFLGKIPFWDCDAV
ncbi:MAG: AraC family transcriptional regulator [Scytonematopsis contorta HA4267-MV1]|jgi:AraC-like DNA-binding protein|nr:AraC family transcriptional regulator [Scytonematopsis contorta HA4267-MV1]